MKPTKGPWHIQVHRKTTVRQTGARLQLHIDEHYNTTISPLHIVDSDGRLVAAVAALDGENEQASNAVLISRIPEVLDQCAALLAVSTGHEAEELRTLLLRVTGDPKFG